MLTNDMSLEHYQVDIGKLQAYGFQKTPEGYTWTRQLKVPSFALEIVITGEKRLKTRITDLDVNEVYMLHLNGATQGEFVGRVRQEYSEIMTQLLATCFREQVFVAAQSLSVIQFIKQQYDIDFEYLWTKFPRNAIARRQDNQKWFAALLTVERSKIGLSGEGIIEILDLKMRPEDKERFIDNLHYLPGYHMNKNHWFTMCLDGRVSDEAIFSKIVASYQLAQ